MSIVVVGAGVSGLVSAWELHQAGATVLVLEREARVGGIIRTERADGFVVEAGPDGFPTGRPEVSDLATRLGIADRIVDQLTRGAQRWTGEQFESLSPEAAAAMLGIDAEGTPWGAGLQSFAGGMAELTDALHASLGDAVRLKQEVTGLMAQARGWAVTLSDGSVVAAEGVVLAVPTRAAAGLLTGVDAECAHELATIDYRPSLNVSLAYTAEQVDRSFEGSGMVSAMAYRGRVRACSYSSRKFPDRAPPGHVLLRAFLAPTVGADRAVAAAHAELASMLGLRGNPRRSWVYRWERGLPQYGADHAARVAAVRARLATFPSLALAGAGYDGSGIGACIVSGRTAARSVLRAPF